MKQVHGKDVATVSVPGTTQQVDGLVTDRKGLALAVLLLVLALGVGIAFGAVMGVVGGLLPAVKAARLPITTALREAPSAGRKERPRSNAMPMVWK